ncbi:alpha-ribazole phosphatase [Duganella sp. CF517]|uniref:histidine phosphatase family protein n=1 Tax=Duganella sp. CF517 TaxID=1881038 RepID=UPI0008AF27AC|nr:histidine phosphatase family protein [Duganella sp. CF517]SEO64492.1 alpha-ribazole phosphatase [Duganella sp. CF517]
MRLILVRHPQPLVAAGVCYGSTDLQVAPAQLARTLAALAPQLPAGLPVYSSPLRRCAELAAGLSAAPLYDARLVEMHFGDWEMRPWDDIPRADVDAWAADLVNYQPGGGESVLRMAARIAAFHADLQRQLGDDGEAIVICHAGAMRLLSACHSGLPAPEMALQAARTPHHIAYGATLILE